MKVLLLYYTGTYNTSFLSQMIKEKWLGKAYEVDCVEINEKSKELITESYDLIGLGYPIYGFNSPRRFNHLLRRIKFKENQSYFIYKNSGETLGLNNASSRVIKRIMRRKKACLVGEYHFVMPYNIRFRYEDDFVRQILHYDRKLLDIMDYELEHGIVHKIKSNPIYDIASFFVSIQKIGGPVNSFFYKVDKNKCTSCGLCMKTCPRQNIYLKKGKIRFHHRCDMCMRCSFFCPENAIKIGFLEGWKVNGKYDLETFSKSKDNPPPFINNDSKGFYKCFIKKFDEIDKNYSEIYDCSGSMN